MLNLLVAMIKAFLSFFVPLFMLSPVTAAIPAVEITSPQTGQVLQGNISIKGTTSADGFVSGEISYAYDQTNNETWFLIGALTQPVTNDVLAVWDTSTISDGDYKIRLSVKYSDGDVKESVLDHVLVRNYTAVESTSTPTQVIVEALPSTPTLTPTITLSPEVIVTPYPANPGALTDSQFQKELKSGVIIGSLAAACLGIYALFRYLKFHR